MKRKLDEISDKYDTSPGYCVRSSDGAWDAYVGKAGSLESCKQSCDDNLMCTAFSNTNDNVACYLHYGDFKGSNIKPEYYKCYTLKPKFI